MEQRTVGPSFKCCSPWALEDTEPSDHTVVLGKARSRHRRHRYVGQVSVCKGPSPSIVVSDLKLKPWSTLSVVCFHVLLFIPTWFGHGASP